MTYEADMADTFLFLLWDQNVLTIWQAWFSASPIICKKLVESRNRFIGVD
jgi:hypothetical protein